MIEEINDLPATTLRATYQQAREWLATSESQEIKLRLGDAPGKVTASVSGEFSSSEATEIILIKPGTLQQRMADTERETIRRALAQANGSVTHTASLLGMKYQSLAFIVESRQRLT